MVKIAILGPSDFDAWSKIDELHEFKIKDIVETIIEEEIIITPTKESVAEYVGALYKSLGGKKLIGIIPMDDTEFGIENLDEFSCDEIINSVTWRNNACKYNDESDILLVLGFSEGVLAEIALSKWFNKPKVIVINDFITQKLPSEATQKINIKYINYDELGHHILEKK